MCKKTCLLLGFQSIPYIHELFVVFEMPKIQFTFQNYCDVFCNGFVEFMVPFR